MYKVHIKPHWEIAYDNEAPLDTANLLMLLTGIQQSGSIARAAQLTRYSYRHAWGLLRDAERIFGNSLIDSGRGRGTTLTDFASKLLWADRLVTARLSPTLDSLASELEVELGKTVGGKPETVRLNASHGFAVAALLGQINEARLPVEVDIASEFRYRDPPLDKKAAMIVISQSGETADTLAALNFAKAAGQKTLAVVNVAGSSIARAADGIIQTQAGPEIGVASTKAFTAQLTVLACLAIDAAHKRKTLDEPRRKEMVKALIEAPGHINHVLQQHKRLEEASQHLFECHDVLYFGRGANYPIALEGALKLKEISYIHAEGYAAGELKHGPIALIDENMPVVVITPHDAVFEKTASNIQEVVARGARVFVITDTEGAKKLSPKPFWHMAIPKVDPFIAPLVYVIPLQLLAYYTALAKGTDVDQPRNLAKSVTVE